MSDYRGRFAPTPTGPLHFGSLFAAVVSYLDAKANQGQWLLRIEDIDPPREQPGAKNAILKTLEAHRLHWDETETYQSDNTQRYLANLGTLNQQERLFWCGCSRKQLAGCDVYPGYCRDKTSEQPDSAIRFRVLTELDAFQDAFQGTQTANIKQQYGDVVLRRRDQWFAYQLAVVSDDISSGITEVIRGIDLIDSTYWQRELYRAFGHPMPIYGHFPVLFDRNAQQKLSKQNLATAVIDTKAEANLMAVFRLLKLDITPANTTHMLQEAVSLWNRNKLRSQQSIYIDQ